MNMSLETHGLHDRAQELNVLIQEALGQTGHVSMRRLSISVDDGIARLEGRVETYYEKQLAQNQAWGVDGIEQVENLIEVG